MKGPVTEILDTMKVGVPFSVKALSQLLGRAPNQIDEIIQALLKEGLIVQSSSEMYTKLRKPSRRRKATQVDWVTDAYEGRR